MTTMQNTGDIELQAKAYPEDVLLIFIGHSDDANDEAEAILGLQTELERKFRDFLALQGEHSRFRSLRVWEWNNDASSKPGGQQTVVAPVLSQARIALFVFNARIGPVTWDEIKYMQERSRHDNLRIIALFSAKPPESLDLSKKNDLSQWNEVVDKRDELTLYWTNPDIPSVTPLDRYRDMEHLKSIALEGLSNAIHGILCDQAGLETRELQHNFPDLDRRYQATLTEELNKIRLLGSPAIQNVQVGLDDTFVPLRISHTWKTDHRFKRRTKKDTVMQEEMRTHTPDELLRRVFPAYRLLLVIGDPGAGKTTLLKYYALCCLQKKLERLFSDAGPVRVFYLPLRELKLDDNRNYRTLPEQLSLWSSARANSIDAKVFEEWLRNAGGAKSLVLLDGLDEISDLELRKTSCKWIDNQFTGFPETFFVVTSRLTGYRKTEGVELEADHIRADVMDFTAEQQQEFLSKWFKTAYCRELCPADLDPEAWIAGRKQAAEERMKTIVEYLGKDENRGLRELAAVPMMLQIMAILWKEREFLPGNRVKLYSAALDYLLEYRDERRGIPPLLPADKARLVLAPIALWMQEELEADEAERSAMHSEMQKVLTTLDHPPTAVVFCKNLVDRAGLLVEYGEERREYLFRHKTFREYLAGSQLTENIKRNSGLIALMVEHFGEDWWNEPITFFMAQADAGMFDKFMECLFDSEVSEEFSSKQQSLLQTVVAEAPQKTTNALNKKLLEPDTTANRQRYILDCLQSLEKAEASEAVGRFMRDGLAHSSEIASKAEEVFDVLFARSAIPPLLKKELTKLRQKKSSNIITNPFEFDAQYIRIPGGKYIYSQPEPDGTAVTVPDRWFAKYPVTKRQYRSFIEFLVGKQPEFNAALNVKVYSQALQELANSRNEAVKGFKSYLKEESDLVQRFMSKYDEDRKFNKDDQPVVGVSWYAARAYCLWLSMLSGEEYRLPTEQEWEWAAGGRREEAGKVQMVKEYPWGDKPEPTAKHANFNENEGATTPVGRYPDGATPEGLYDMAGNVWEWMEDWSDNRFKYKALRGGSWGSRPGNLRCRVRDNDNPVNWIYGYVGFRVVRPSPKMNI